MRGLPFGDVGPTAAGQAGFDVASGSAATCGRPNGVFSTRAARLGTLHELTKLAPVAIIAEAFGYSPATIERHATDSATAYAAYIAAVREAWDPHDLSRLRPAAARSPRRAAPSVARGNSAAGVRQDRGGSAAGIHGCVCDSLEDHPHPMDRRSAWGCETTELIASQFVVEYPSVARPRLVRRQQATDPHRHARTTARRLDALPVS